MYVTKYSHSCLYVEDQNVSVLIDPGNYSVDEGLRPDLFNSLNYLLITHEHQDHFYIPFIKLVLQKFPEVKIITNKSVSKILEQENIHIATESVRTIYQFDAPHQKALKLPPPINTGFTIMDTLTHPGDSLAYSHSARILAMPIVGSWGSTVACLDKAIELGVEKVIPIHDWHWRDEAREWYYDMASDYLKSREIVFVPIKDGIRTEI